MLKKLSFMFTLLVAVCLSLSITSCSDDKDNNEEPDEPGIVVDSEIAGTEWKLTGITGFMSDAISDWRGEILEFDNHGVVTEVNSDGTYKGSYILSGKNLTLSKIPLTNMFGEQFKITLSGNTLKLAGAASFDDTVLIFSRK